MSFLDPQNPGIGGLDELTDSETLLIQQLTALGDPGADRILFWDDSAGTYAYLTVGSGLSISGTSLTSTATGDVTKVGTPVNNQIGVWTGDGTLEGDAALTFDTTTDTLSTVDLSLSNDLLLASGSIINFNSGDITITHSANTLTFTGGTIVLGTTSVNSIKAESASAGILLLNNDGVTVASFGVGSTSSTNIALSGSVALGTNNITMTGSIGVTGSRVTKGWFTDIESTNIPTVGGVAILTSLTAPQFTTIELSHATDNTLSASGGILSIESVAIPTISSTHTLTNKRITQRVVTTADDATAVIDVDVTDQYQLTAMANATTISTTGTPTAGQKLTIRLKDDGTGRALTWDGVFRAIGVTLPTTTVANKTHYIGCIYNLTDTKWDVVAVVAQA